MKCKQCNNKILKNDIFCINCGNKINRYSLKDNIISKHKKTSILASTMIIMICITTVVGINYYNSENRIDPDVDYNQEGDERYPLPYTDYINKVGSTENVLADCKRTISLSKDDYGWVNLTLKWNSDQGDLLISKHLYPSTDIVKEIDTVGYYSILLQRKDSTDALGSISIENSTNTVFVFDVWIDQIQKPIGITNLSLPFYLDTYWRYDSSMHERYVHIFDANDYDFYAIWLNVGDVLTTRYSSNSSSNAGYFYRFTSSLFVMHGNINYTHTCTNQGYYVYRLHLYYGYNNYIWLWID